MLICFLESKEFDPNTKELINSLVLDPVPFFGLRYHAMTAVNSKQCFIHGGQHFQSKDDSSDKLWLITISPRSGKVNSALVSMSNEISRYGHKIVCIEDNLYIIGGFSGNRKSDFVTKLEIEKK